MSLCARLCVSLCESVGVCVCVCVFILVSVCLFVSVYVKVYLCVRVRVCVNDYTHLWIYVVPSGVVCFTAVVIWPGCINVHELVFAEVSSWPLTAPAE